MCENVCAVCMYKWRAFPGAVQSHVHMHDEWLALGLQLVESGQRASVGEECTHGEGAHACTGRRVCQTFDTNREGGEKEAWRASWFFAQAARADP